MEANPRNLDALFNSQLRYVVPMFQRLYVWKEDSHWSNLWEDVSEKADLQVAGKQTNAHYLGALIIEGVRPSSPREVKRFLVIDGQQRLTTLQLLFCAFRDIARANEWKTLDRATTRYLENVDPDVMEHPEEEVWKLWPTTLNRDIFRSILTAGSRQDVGSKFPLIKLPPKRKYEPRSNLVEAYFFFSYKIEGWIDATAEETGKSNEECAFLLLQSLQQDFCVVQIVLSEGDDSQEIFHSLNSQAKPLSQSDLLRSLIFMRAEKEKLNRDKIFDDYWSRFETDFWSREVSRGGRTYTRLDLGMRFFLMAKTGELVDARRVSEDYRRWITNDPPRYTSVREELKDFCRHAEEFQYYEALPGNTLPSTDFRRVLRDLDVSTALPLVLHLRLDAGLSDVQVSECLSILESFLVRRAFVGEETREYNKFFVEVVGNLLDKPADEIVAALSKKLLGGIGSTRRWPVDDDIIEASLTRPVYALTPTPVLRLVLERLELAHRTNKSEETALPSGLQIEHVLPRGWGHHWPLQGKNIPKDVVAYPYLANTEFADLVEGIRTRNSQLNTLGNLTLLNEYLNPAASNGSFDIKRVEYKHSVLRLNRYFDEQGVWDEDAISARGKALGKMICNIWPKPVQL